MAKTYEEIWASAGDAYKARFGGDKAKAIQAMKDWNKQKYGTTEPTKRAEKWGGGEQGKKNLAAAHADVKKTIAYATSPVISYHSSGGQLGLRDVGDKSYTSSYDPKKVAQTDNGTYVFDSKNKVQSLSAVNLAGEGGPAEPNMKLRSANTTTVKPSGNTGGTLMNRANSSASSPDPKEFLRMGGKDIEVKSIKLSSGKTSDVANIPTNFDATNTPGRAGTIQEGYEGVAKTLKQGGMRLNPVSAKTGNPTEIKRESSINRTADNDAALMRGLGSRKEVRQAVKSGFIGKDQKKSAMSYAKANKQLAKQERKSTSAADKSQSFGTKTKTKTIKVGAERDISGNIIPGGRAAGTYKRTKTVSIDPTSGKKVRTREYKRIS